jgi:Tol biopolymer transport system component
MSSRREFFNRPVFRMMAGLLLLITWVLPEVSAQYFGRNKVQYDNFDFRFIQTENFDIYYYPEKENAIMDIGRMTERWYHRLSQVFQHEFDERKPIIFYADDADFQQTNVISGFIGQGVGGVTEGMKNRIVMPVSGTYAGTDHVLGHELVHVFQFDIAQRDSEGFRMQGIPLWFIEGMAEYLTLGRDHPLTAMWLRDAIVRDDFPTIQKLTREPHRYFPYRFGHAFWAYVGAQWGDDKIHRLYRSAGRGGIESAFQNILELTTEEFSEKWKQVVIDEYAPFIEERKKPREAGELILAMEIDAGNVNIGPSVSPDGEFVAFLSERELFTIEMFLANARTGEVQKRLFSAERDSHFDALRFINSAGAWSPDGERLAFIVFAKGTNKIAILNVDNRRDIGELPIEGVGTVSSMSWSPDGEYLALAGMKGGIGNLYKIHIETGKVTQLTDDRSTVLHPAWSPDGKTIAYVTERPEDTDFGKLIYGNVAIALYDLRTGTIERPELFGKAMHTNPQFSPDGEKLYFIASPDGVANVYRYSFDTGTIDQITNISTGTSGITFLSPALTVARNTGRILFSVFESGNYNVYAIEPEETEALIAKEVGENPKYIGYLPPSEAVDKGFVENYLADIEGGLVATTVFPSQDYTPRLELDFIGSTGIGVTVGGPFGTGVFGGASFFFSDMLGDHNLFTAIQAQGTFRDIGGTVAYTNLSSRLNWGAVVSRIPLISGFTYLEQTNQGLVVNRRLDRMFINSAQLLGNYPFNMSRRLELRGGFSHIAFRFEEERFFSGQLGQRRGSEAQVVDSPDPLNLFETSLAYVGDTSFFGFTSPVRGERFRFQASGNIGSIQFYQLLGDYRRYFQVSRNLTFAFRGMHIGRYGPDAENGIITPIFLGQPQFVRGYNIFSLRAGEFNQLGHLLLGSRIAVTNIEARIPLFGFDRLGLINFPFVPTELSFFFDGGLAWDNERSPVFRLQEQSPEQIPIFSAGVSTRFNFFGALIVEAFYVHPFQRPDRGAHIGFQLSPGW